MSEASNLRHFLTRTARYLELGYDRVAAAGAVAGLVEPARDGSALDVGTGHGLLAVALAKRDLRVTSGDLSTQNYGVAAGLAVEAGVVSRLHFVLFDGTQLPFPDRHFDCVAMMNVLHHLDRAEPVLAELARVVKPRGQIVISDFSEAGFAVVSRAHREGGIEHPRSGVTLDMACTTLGALGWRLVGRVTQHLQDMARFDLEVGRPQSAGYEDE